jgi:hypothetical protein
MFFCLCSFDSENLLCMWTDSTMCVGLWHIVYVNWQYDVRSTVAYFQECYVELSKYEISWSVYKI